MTSIIETLNHLGEGALHFAWPMFWQSSLLIVLVFGLDWALRRKVRAGVRYALWLVVLVKLVLPPSLALPTGPAWWLRRPTPETPESPTHAPVVIYSDEAISEPPVELPPVITSAPQAHFSAAALALIASVAASVSFFGLLLVRWRQIMRGARNAEIAPAWLEDLLEESRLSAGVRRPVRLKLLERAVSPAVCGLLRPVILVQRALLDRLSSSQIRAILLHELAHLRRGDVWVNCIQALLQIAYWWHPLLWLANARIRRLREEAVDDAVMLALREDAETYAPTLLEVARLALQRPLASLGLVGILESHRSIRQRIERLIEFRPPGRTGFTFGSLLCVVALGAFAVPMGEGPAKVAETQTVPPLGADAQVVSTMPESTSNKSAIQKSQETALVTKGAADNTGPRGTNGASLDILKIQDEVHVTFADLPQPQQPIDDQVKQDGTITLLYNHTFQVAGKTRKDVEKEIHDFYVPNYFRNMTVTVRVVASTQFYYVNGEVKMPNRQVYIGPTTVSRAIASAGGFTDFAQKRAVGNPNFVPTNNQRKAIYQKLNQIVRDDIALENLEDYAVLFSAKTGPNAEQLYTRIFKVDPNTFLLGLQRKLGHAVSPNDVPEAVRDLFTRIGVDMAPPKSIWYKPAQGMLLIRASSKDLDIIQKTIAALNTPEPQIEIKARFVAMPEQAAAEFWKNLGPLIGATNLTAQVTPSQMKVLLHAVQEKPKANLLSESSVTTLSGRQVQVQCVDLTTVVTGIDPKALTPPGVGTNSYVTKTVPLGPTLDFVPSIGPGGQTIRLGVIASINEFLGYEKPTNSVTIYINGKKGQTIPPLPQFHASAVTNSVEIRDGNTVVLGGIQSVKVSVVKDKVPFLGGLPMLGSLFRSQSKLCETNQLLVFITPTLIDPAGNRLHPNNKESASTK